MGRPSQNRPRPAAAEVMVKRRQAVEARLAGAGYATIAEQLGYAGPSGAYQAVREGLKEAIREPAQEVVDRELDRLDAMLMGLWAKARRGDPSAVDRVLRIMDRRAKYLGLDQAQQLEVTTRDGDLADLDAAARTWAAQQTSSGPDRVAEHGPT